eukprot:4007523-Amphidinium_carterae.1
MNQFKIDFDWLAFEHGEMPPPKQERVGWDNKILKAPKQRAMGMGVATRDKKMYEQHAPSLPYPVLCVQ